MPQQYVGTKIITATPMTRAEYNAYRDWVLPADENGDDTGYLVEYLDGGAANHPQHTGYISWSPSDVFEKSYLPIGDVEHLPAHQQRVIAEKAELDTRLNKLLAFFDSETYAELDFEEKDRLSHQGAAMKDYSTVLGERIAAF